MASPADGSINTVNKDNSPPVGLDPSHLQILTSVMVDLGAVAGPAEDAFLAITAVLGEASNILGEVQGSFEGLVERLQGRETTENMDGLEKAIERIAALSKKNNGSNEVLVRLDEVAQQIESSLTALSKVIGEVGGLAINAKIQAALIVASGIDFTVFTSEIERLRGLAQQTIEQTGGRLQALRHVILDARAEENNFERDALQELTRVQDRLQDGIAIIANQRRAASVGAQQASAHSKDTAQRVGASMMELQFNDTACQRIQHVRDAMAIIIELARNGGEENIAALVGAVCRLQARQLSRTAADYQERVEVLIGHLREIANDALNICDDADAAMSVDNHAADKDGHNSFVSSLQKDVSIGAQLLQREASGQERVRSIVQSVSSGFTEMKTDIDAINSIDADMRVMGLNATFKCSRLGDSGRALGVIAHELRSCSKRTEEISCQVSNLLQTAMEMSGALGAHEGDETEMVSELGKWMVNSARDLGLLSVKLDASLEKLRKDGEHVAELLAKTAGGIVVHRHMSQSLISAGEKLEGIADAIGVDGADIGVMGERIRTLLEGHYTMQSERLIHQIFVDCYDDENVGQAENASAAGAGIDDLLF